MRIAFRFVIIFAVLFFGLNVSHAMGQFFFFENPMVGEQAPDFTLNTLTQKAVNFSSYRAGKPAIVFFWATWCPHCRTQLIEVQKNQDVFVKQGIKTVLIDLGESPGTVQNFIDKRGLTLDMFLDRESVVAEAYGVIGIPTYYLVDAQGVVRAVEHEIPPNYEELLTSPAQ